MASTIQLKTGTGSAVPSSLAQGEIGINIDNGLIYYGSGSGNDVKQLESFTHITASNNISASGTITASGFLGDGSGLTNITAAAPAGTVSSSAQISSDISGSFTATSASFSTRIVANEAITAKTLISSSAQVTGLISTLSASAVITDAITAGLSAGTDNTVVLLNSSNRMITDEIDVGVWGGNGAVLTSEADLSDITTGIATNVTAVATTDNAEFFIGVLDGASGTQAVETSTKLKQNPSTGKITITGDVSSSGTIIANKIESDQLVSHAGDANTGLSFAADTVVIEGNDVNLGLFATNRIELNKPITASNDISSSGTISADIFNVIGTKQYRLNGDKALYLDSTDIYVGHDQHKTYITSSGVVDITGNITASGTISASGTIYGRQWEQIETNLTANIGSLSGNYDGDDFIFLPWTDTDTENTAIANKFVNRAAVVPGKPIKTAMRATSNALGNTAYTMSLWENKTDQGNNNLVLVTEACADSTGTNREVVTFDWTNPCSGSNVDIAYGSRMWMGIKTTNGNTTYAITHLWEWDYGSL